MLKYGTGSFNGAWTWKIYLYILLPKCLNLFIQYNAQKTCFNKVLIIELLYSKKEKRPFLKACRNTVML